MKGRVRAQRLVSGASRRPTIAPWARKGRERREKTGWLQKPPRSRTMPPSARPPALEEADPPCRPLIKENLWCRQPLERQLTCCDGCYPEQMPVPERLMAFSKRLCKAAPHPAAPSWPPTPTPLNPTWREWSTARAPALSSLSGGSEVQRTGASCTLVFSIPLGTRCRRSLQSHARVFAAPSAGRPSSSVALSVNLSSAISDGT